MANSKPARARRREALAWVISNLPDPDSFTTHDVVAMGDLLRDQKWPPYTKAAWRRVSARGADSVGLAIGRHPDFAKDPDGIENRERHGFRIRSQRWLRK